MRFLLLSLVCTLASLKLLGQKTEDNTIVVTVNDTTRIYERVRQAITFTDLIIREDTKRDTLVTQSERIHGTSIFVVAKVVIKGNKVEISGGYGLGLEDFWGYPAWPRSYKRVTYFKGSEAWQVLRRIAIKLDGKIDFYKAERDESA